MVLLLKVLLLSPRLSLHFNELYFKLKLLLTPTQVMSLDVTNKMQNHGRKRTRKTDVFLEAFFKTGVLTVTVVFSCVYSSALKRISQLLLF